MNQFIYIGRTQHGYGSQISYQQEVQIEHASIVEAVLPGTCHTSYLEPKALSGKAGEYPSQLGDPLSCQWFLSIAHYFELGDHVIFRQANNALLSINL